jgi:hypothetical protein
MVRKFGSTRDTVIMGGNLRGSSMVYQMQSCKHRAQDNIESNKERNDDEFQDIHHPTVNVSFRSPPLFGTLELEHSQPT